MGNFKLNQLKRIEIDLNDSEIKSFFNGLKIIPINLQVIQSINCLDFKSDPADEIIAATSLTYNIPLLTRDEKLIASKKTPLALN